jgi:hypothetical protein
MLEMTPKLRKSLFLSFLYAAEKEKIKERKESKRLLLTPWLPRTGRPHCCRQLHTTAHHITA